MGLRAAALRAPARPPLRPYGLGGDYDYGKKGNPAHDDPNCGSRIRTRLHPGRGGYTGFSRHQPDHDDEPTARCWHLQRVARRLATPSPYRFSGSPAFGTLTGGWRDAAVGEIDASRGLRRARHRTLCAGATMTRYGPVVRLRCWDAFWAGAGYRWHFHKLGTGCGAICLSSAKVALAARAADHDFQMVICRECGVRLSSPRARASPMASAVIGGGRHRLDSYIMRLVDPGGGGGVGVGGPFRTRSKDAAERTSWRRQCMHLSSYSIVVSLCARRAREDISCGARIRRMLLTGLARTDSMSTSRDRSSPAAIPKKIVGDNAAKLYRS